VVLCRYCEIIVGDCGRKLTLRSHVLLVTERRRFTRCQMDWSVEDWSLKLGGGKDFRIIDRRFPQINDLSRSRDGLWRIFI